MSESEVDYKHKWKSDLVNLFLILTEIAVVVAIIFCVGWVLMKVGGYIAAFLAGLIIGMLVAS